MLEAGQTGRRGEAVELAGRAYRATIKPLDPQLLARGRLLLLIPEETN